ncbi:MAG: Nramp family divalent metal transporter [Candidatus Shapirobacteria bacterium]|nr:Nramp family divalent metal transporter [Candidatus Shapirobacteria bacterium]
MKLNELGKAELPKAPRFGKMVGPSFVLLGMGLGSGELIIWPYLAANFGLGIIWAAVIGITFQFFINMEIERYTLITGESVFVGLARKLKIISPVWFILSTIIPWMWPGIILSSAVVMANVFGFKNTSLVAIVMLISIGLILSLSNIAYKTQEKIQKLLIFIGVPFIFLLTFFLAERTDWQNLAQGLIGQGNGFWLIPAALPLVTFLGAFAYSGAGGNLNLAQSFYIREKEYGMGKYGGKITSLLKKNNEKFSLEGKTFLINKENLKIFKEWWQKINLEHLLVFWLTGAITILLLSLLAFATVYQKTDNLVGIDFLFREGQNISEATIPVIGTFFLLLVAMMLFSTQLSVMDATSRISSENLVIINQKKFKPKNLPHFYFSFLWIQIILGVIILLAGFKEPLQLVVISAFLNAITMLVYSVAILWLNQKTLAKELKPSLWRKVILLLVILFFGFFSWIVIRGN